MRPENGADSKFIGKTIKRPKIDRSFVVKVGSKSLSRGRAKTMSKFTHEKKIHTKRVASGARPLHRSKFPARAKLFATAGISLAPGTLSGGEPAILLESEQIVPFVYQAPQSALDDLKQRLTQTRWPERETTNDWSEGVPLKKLRALVEYS